RLRLLRVAHGERDPDALVEALRPRFWPRLRYTWRRYQVFRRRLALAIEAREGGGDVIDVVAFEQRRDDGAFFVCNRIAEHRVIEQALLVALLHVISGGLFAPMCFDLGVAQKALCAAACWVGHDEDAGALAPGAASSAAAVEECFRVLRQIGVNDEIEI